MTREALFFFFALSVKQSNNTAYCQLSQEFMCIFIGCVLILPSAPQIKIRSIARLVLRTMKTCSTVRPPPVCSLCMQMDIYIYISRELGVNPSNPKHGLDLKSSMLVVQSRRQRLRNVRLCCPLVVARNVRLCCPLVVARNARLCCPLVVAGNIRLCCPLVVVLDDAGLAEVQSHTANPAPESLMVNPPVMFVRH